MSNSVMLKPSLTDDRQLATVDTEVKAMLGPPPLLVSEDPAAYESLRIRVRSAVAPADFIEELWVRDVVDLMWETLRLRRLGANLMTAVANKGLREFLTPKMPAEEWRALVEGWARRDPTAVEQINALLEKEGEDALTLGLRTIPYRLKDFDRIDRMVAQTEARRNSILREVDRHRETVARRLRDAVTDIEDADFEDVAA